MKLFKLRFTTWRRFEEARNTQKVRNTFHPKRWKSYGLPVGSPQVRCASNSEPGTWAIAHAWLCDCYIVWLCRFGNFEVYWRSRTPSYLPLRGLSKTRNAYAGREPLQGSAVICINTSGLWRHGTWPDSRSPGSLGGSDEWRLHDSDPQNDVPSLLAYCFFFWPWWGSWLLLNAIIFVRSLRFVTPHNIIWGTHLLEAAKIHHRRAHARPWKWTVHEGWKRVRN